MLSEADKARVRAKRDFDRQRMRGLEDEARAIRASKEFVRGRLSAWDEMLEGDAEATPAAVAQAPSVKKPKENLIRRAPSPSDIKYAIFRALLDGARKWVPRSEFWGPGKFERKKFNARLDLMEAEGLVQLTRDKVRLTGHGSAFITAVLEELESRFGC
jgi:hypothetical protein